MNEREDLQQVLDKLGWDYKVPEKKSLMPMGGLIISKERELLKRVIKVFDSVYSADLIDEIEELLAQPEQEQESVAWYWEQSDWNDTEWSYIEHTGDKPWFYMADIDKPRESEYRRNLRPLYTSPPSRKPLSEDNISALLMGGFSTHLIDLVRMVEKAHGIGDRDE